MLTLKVNRAIMTSASSRNLAACETESNYLEVFLEICTLNILLVKKFIFLVWLHAQNLQLNRKATQGIMFFKNFAKTLEGLSLYFKKFKTTFLKEL